MMSTRQIIILFCLIIVLFPLSGCAEFVGGFVAGYMQADSPSKVSRQSSGNGQNSSPASEIAYTTPKRPIYASQLPTIVYINEEDGNVTVGVSMPSGTKEIGLGSKGRVYTIDENNNTESLIAEIEVIALGDGIVHARRTNGSKTIKIKDGDVVRFGDS